MTSVIILLAFMLLAGVAIVIVSYCTANSMRRGRGGGRDLEMGERNRLSRERIEYSVISTDDVDDEADNDDEDPFSLQPILKPSA
jgi:hypothetical protein